MLHLRHFLPAVAIDRVLVDPGIAVDVLAVGKTDASLVVGEEGHVATRRVDDVRGVAIAQIHPVGL